MISKGPGYSQHLTSSGYAPTGPGAGRAFHIETTILSATRQDLPSIELNMAHFLMVDFRVYPMSETAWPSTSSDTDDAAATLASPCS